MSYLISGSAIFSVKAFFIVSGFYMALVLEERYKSRPVSSFYASRFLRILPAYWVVAIIALAIEFLFIPRGQMFHPLASPIANGLDFRINNMPIGVAAYVFLTQFTLIGMESGFWVEFNRYDGQISFSPDFAPYSLSVFQISPTPQTWSIGIELLFYLIAPFVVRRHVLVIIALAIGSLGFRALMHHWGYSGQPWNRTLFLSELVYFLGGVLSYRLFRWLPEWKSNIAISAPVSLGLLAIGPICSPITNAGGGTLLLDTVPYILIAAGMPFLFSLTKDNRIDREIGELSYPIYIVHLLVLGIIYWSPALRGLGASWTWLFVNLGVVVLAAIALDRLVVRPVDRFRVRFGARAPVGEATSAALQARTPDARPNVRPD